MTRTLKILGLMSGSSLDGLDLATVEYEIDGDSIRDWKVLYAASYEYPEKWQSKLESAPAASGYKLASLHAETGNFFGDLCLRFIEESGITPDYIASHGHTVMHAPKLSFTLQIGDASHIAVRAGVPTISDFRTADIAAGGQGAPLAPIVEQYLYKGYGMYLNLGGIANISAHGDSGILAWDVCPCNQLLNFSAGRKDLPYDQDGLLARTGSVDQALLGEFRKIIPLPHSNPYSLDNTFILTKFISLLKASFLSVEDQLCTSVEYISDCITKQAKQARNLLGTQPTMLITGGSAHNTFLIERLKARLSQHSIEAVVPDDATIDFKEAILMSLCGLLRILQKPNALASVTGASRDTVNGGVYLP